MDVAGDGLDSEDAPGGEADREPGKALDACPFSVVDRVVDGSEDEAAFTMSWDSVMAGGELTYDVGAVEILAGVEDGLGVVLSVEEPSTKPNTGDCDTNSASDGGPAL